MVTEFYQDRRVLVTGSSGFLATNLVEALKDTKCFIRKLSRGTSFPVHGGAARIEDMSADIAEEATWERALDGIDIVFHFAAQTGVSVANEDPVADFGANVLPMLRMLEACRKKNLHPVVLFSGTVTEAGITDRIPVDENVPDNPVTVYDLHKLMAENYLKYYVKQGMVRGAALRLANVYGPGPRSSGANRGVLNGMIEKALEGRALTIYGQGNYVRDYIYVRDVVVAFLAAGASIDRLNGRHYVIGSGTGHTIAETVRMVASRVERVSGSPVAVMHVDLPDELSPIEQRNFVADTTHFSSRTGWMAGTSLAEGIDLTIDYFVREAEVAS
jgi:nucleoside-diphosphate-sugar epimerase